MAIISLSERTKSIARGVESMGKRINQVVDRYLQLLAAYQVELRADFSDADWALLKRAYTRGTAEKFRSVEELGRILAASVGASTPLGVKIADLEFAELVVFIELLEAEMFAVDSPTAHS